ncbi:cell wall-binding protein YocH [Paraliobacillus quinghaiensis]|uniref:Cell wall-binding protein YocH n=1 Tax=Paraliobacillus quinghaiensis TaxID=470815 RepID=A0A917TR02_9BACI|nr:3D domain-containing protein [Paraliobacillus quinghaiensis]GGM33403.1 cell wall-binding protein YocH [Paraliobacillus quinghaiensis]
MKKKVVALVIGLAVSLTALLTASAEEYQEVQGDNLREIAPKYERIFNELNEEIMFTGQTIQNNELFVYTVKEGDTLRKIAKAHEVKEEDLKFWNLLATKAVQVDQELIIPELKRKKSEPKVKSVQITNDEVVQEEEKETKKATKPETSSKESQKANQSTKTMTMTATAYTAECAGCSGITSTGINLNEDRNKKVIAVDPNVIPLGTKVHVEGYGEAIAGDIGGAIKGNKIDIHVPTKDEAFKWGVRTVKVTILD